MDIQAFVSGSAFKKALATGLISALLVTFVPDIPAVPQIVSLAVMVGVSSAISDQVLMGM